MMPPVTTGVQAQVTRSQDQEKGKMPRCTQLGLGLASVGGWVLTPHRMLSPWIHRPTGLVGDGDLLTQIPASPAPAPP